MSKKLLIVESPAKAKTIEKFLGTDYHVLSSQGHIRDIPSQVFIVALRADHGGVVAAVAQLRQTEPDAEPFGQRAHLGADARVGRYAACHGEGLAARLLERQLCPADQRRAHRLGHRRAERRHVDGVFQSLPI